MWFEQWGKVAEDQKFIEGLEGRHCVFLGNQDGVYN